MPAAKCSPPKSQGVRSYLRAKRKRKAKAPAKGTVYYVVVNERTGKTSGTVHRKWSAAVSARKRLDLQSYRAGRGRPWSVQKRTH